MTTVKIEVSDDGVTISQDSQSKEFSITGKGGRTDTVFVSNEDAPAVIAALQAALNQRAAT